MLVVGDWMSNKKALPFQTLPQKRARHSHLDRPPMVPVTARRGWAPTIPSTVDHTRMILALFAPKSGHRFAAIFFHCAIGMTDQRHDYRGYNINIMPYAGGLRATIYAPDSKQPMLGPQSDDPNAHNEVLVKAKRLIDALLSS